MRDLSYSSPPACPPPGRPACRCAVPGSARPSPDPRTRPPPRPLPRLHEYGACPQHIHGDLHRDRAPQCPGFRKRGPGIERGHCGDRHITPNRLPSPPGRRQAARRPRRSLAPRRQRQPRPRRPGRAPVPPGHQWPEPRSGHGQPLRRRRRRVTRKCRSASGGPAKRVDTVTAVAFPARHRALTGGPPGRGRGSGVRGDLHHARLDDPHHFGPQGQPQGGSRI